MSKKQKKTKINMTAFVIAGMILIYYVALCAVLNNVTASVNTDENKYEEESDIDTDVQEAEEPKKQDILANIQVGDIVTFGVYEQDGDLMNGAEPLEWEVIGEKDGKYLLLTHYVIDCMVNNNTFDVLMANQEYMESFNNWEKSGVRVHLNSTFYDKAFSEEEKEHICLVTNTTGGWEEINDGRLGNGDFRKGPSGGADTQDYVFLLSIEEIREYFSDDFYYWDGYLYDTFLPKLMASPTIYAMRKGVQEYRIDEIFIANMVLTDDGYGVLNPYIYSDHMVKNNVWNLDFYGKVHPDHAKFGYFSSWALRNPGSFTDGSTCLIMKPRGNFRTSEKESIGIRPAIWIECN